MHRPVRLPAFVLSVVFVAAGCGGGGGSGAGGAPAGGSGGGPVAGAGGGPVAGSGGGAPIAGSGGGGPIAGSGGGAVAGSGGSPVAGSGGSTVAAGDWVEVTNLHQGSAAYAGITSAEPASQSGGIMIAYPQISNATYFIYVRPEAGTYNSWRAWGMLTYGGNTPVYVGGLMAGQRYCLNVRAVVGGIEDGNTVEQCATAAATLTPPVPVLAATFTSTAQTHTMLSLATSARLGVGLRYDLERSIDAGTFAVVASRTFYVSGAPYDYQISLDDVPEVAGAYQYRVRVFADGIDVGVSAPKAVTVTAKAWKRPLEVYPQTAILRPLPKLSVDKTGKLVVQGRVTADAATAFPGMARFTGVRRGPDLTGDPTLWKRLLCADQDLNLSVSVSFRSYTVAADGTVYVLEDSVVAGPEASRLNRLFKLSATGCAQIVNTSIHGGVFYLAAHPTDPMKLAVAGGRGVWLSSDGGASFRLYRDPSTSGAVNALGYTADGTLYLAHAKSLAKTSNHTTFTNYAPWPNASETPAEMALSASGTMAVIGAPSPTLTQFGAYVGAAGGPLTFEPTTIQATTATTLVYRDGVAWLSDGRLLVLMSDTGPVGTRDYQWIAVRSTAGTWSTVEIPGTYFGVTPAPVLLDPRTGHENDVYWTYVRSRDGGVSWESFPMGAQAIAATVVGSDLALTMQRFNLTTSMPEGFRSLDGGDTQTAADLLPVDGRVWFNPTAPLIGVNGNGGYTSNGGATWVTSIAAQAWKFAGFAGGGYVYGTLSPTTPALRSADSGASWTGLGAPNRSVACGNGTTGVLSHGDTSGNSGFVSVTGANLGTIRTGAPFASLVACALSADGQTVYLFSSTTLNKSTTGITGTFSKLASPPGGGLMSVSADGKRLVYGSAWSETGGE